MSRHLTPLGRRASLMSLAIAGASIGAIGSASGQSLVPNDPRFNQQWGMRRIQADLAWSITTGSTQVTVAVLDTGVDYTHPDLYLNIWINQGEIPAQVAAVLTDVDGDGLVTFWDLAEAVNQGPGKIADLDGNGRVDGADLLFPVGDGGWADGLDNETNGYADDLVGWDFLEGDNDPADLAGHGTLCAGVIGAIGDNGEGVAGINWKTRIMPVRFIPRGDSSTYTLAELQAAGVLAPLAIAYAANNGARVSSNSWGVSEDLVPAATQQAVYDAITEAALMGHLMVFAAGNQSHDNETFPAELPASFDMDNIVSVAATGKMDQITSFSSFGASTVDLGAPGRLIWSTEPAFIPGVDYFHYQGTSAATPHVAGAAALILSLDPSMSFLEVKAHLMAGVDPLDDLQGVSVTGGRLNVFKAVLSALE